MKPDQHKQKRSMQYKKKHGIANPSKSKEDGSSNHHRLRPEDKNSKKMNLATGKTSKTKNRAASDQSQAGSGTRNASQSNNCNDDEVSLSSDDSDYESSSQPRKTFRRRQIVSNWQRYEIPEKEQGAEEEILGEDFNKLLSSAGSAISQFRFRDEQDWLPESPDGIDSEAGLLAVNAEQISEALQCIPLYEVLRLEKNLFSTEQIEAIDVAAKLCKDAFTTDKYASSFQHSKLPSKPHGLRHTDERKVGNNQPEYSDVKNQKTVTNIDLDSLLDGAKAHAPLTKNLKEESKVLNESVIPKVRNEPVIPAENKASSNNPDETGDGELDFLLSLEKPVENVSSIHKPLAEKESTKNTKELEDWLDSVLDA